MTKKIKVLPCYGAVRRKPPKRLLETLGHLRQGSLFFILKIQDL